MTRRAWKIDDHEARRLAKTYALDECGCGHQRREHADRSGAPRRCQLRACSCMNYARVKEVRPLAI